MHNKTGFYLDETDKLSKQDDFVLIVFTKSVSIQIGNGSEIFRNKAYEKYRNRRSNKLFYFLFQGGTE